MTARRRLRGRTLNSAEHEQAANPITRRRKTAVWLVIVVSTVVLLIGSVTIWVKRELLDTNNFTASTTELMRNPQVQSAMAAFLVDQVGNCDAAAPPTDSTRDAF